nr:protein Aster-B-like [Labrus bergylta]
MDQVSYRSVGSDEITDESASVLEDRWSSSEEEASDPQAQCLAAPQAPLPTYKQRFDEFKKLFKELPESERLIVDYPCALQRDILLQGRLYLSENWLCFYSNVFRGTKIILTLKDVVTMTREKTARLIPNAIQVCTSTDKYFFTSFSAREKSYLGVFRMWQNTLLDKVRPCFTHLLFLYKVTKLQTRAASGQSRYSMCYAFHTSVTCVKKKKTCPQDKHFTCITNDCH